MNWNELIEQILSDDFEAVQKLEESLERLYRSLEEMDGYRDQDQSRFPNLVQVLMELTYFVRLRARQLDGQDVS